MLRKLVLRSTTPIIDPIELLKASIKSAYADKNKGE